jgi:hypothetical protein
MKNLIILTILLIGFLPLHGQEDKSNDLSVCYIKRLPEIEYVWNSSSPDVDGWPEDGQEVTWRAYIKNWSENPIESVSYRWEVNDQNYQDSVLNIAPGEMFHVDLEWNWDPNRHIIKFIIDHEDQIEEFSELNNSLTIYSDALALRFYVEQSLYDYFHEHQHKLNVGTNSWDDWAQHLHVTRWNKMMADAIYPETPLGVLDRFRLDSIIIVPDGSLPLAGGLPTNNPNQNDRVADLVWGFIWDEDNDFYSNHYDTVNHNPFFFEGSLFHELGHARYLIDQYGFDLHHHKTENNILIEEDGELIVGTSYMPFIAHGSAIYYNKHKGYMGGGDYWVVGRHSAAALNLITGHRALCGNYNAPCNIGVYLNDLPNNNMLTITDQQGNPLEGVSVKLFQASEQPGHWYGKYYDNTPDIELLTNENGKVLLGRCPFSADGVIAHTGGYANGLLIVRLQYDDIIDYQFLEITDFNLEYWRGNTEIGNYAMQMEVDDVSTDEKNIQNTNIKIYPNPANQFIKVSLPENSENNFIVEIFDLPGKKVFSNSYHQSNSATISLNDFFKGVYLVKVNVENINKTQKLIIH